MTAQIKTYLVGGYVRDQLLGVPSKDLDYSVVVEGAKTIEDAWQQMRQHIIESGYEIFLETPDYQTIRARGAQGPADYVLAREEGPYLDGRRPSWTRPGTLEDDLKRRDFTVNSLARAADGNLIDLFGGEQDLTDRVLRAVGNAEDRLAEDPLRAFRAIRFAVTKDFSLHSDLYDAVKAERDWGGVSTDRIREELHKAFAFDTRKTVLLLVEDYPNLLNLALDRGIWFEPTVKETP